MAAARRLAQPPAPSAARSAARSKAAGSAAPRLALAPGAPTLAQALTLGAKALRAEAQRLAFDANRATRAHHTDAGALRAMKLHSQAIAAAELLEEQAADCKAADLRAQLAPRA